MNADGSAQKQLTTVSGEEGGGVDSTWSPSGTELAFVRASAIFVMHDDGSDVVQLTQHPLASIDPAWSSDGDKIAFTRVDFGCGDIYVMKADGSAQTNLTQTPHTGAGFGCEVNPSWSPDGTKLTFSAFLDGYRSDEIYTMNADGSGLRRLTALGSAQQPAWSPDGREIAFTSAHDGDLEIYVMNADGTGVTKVTDNEAIDRAPDWQPLPFKNVSKRCKAFPGAFRNHGACVRAGS